MKYTGPKIKKARRLGVALSPKSEKYLERRPNVPGQHGGNRRRGKQSDYGRQLMEKQRLRHQYNLSEKQLRSYYKKAVRKPGNTGDVMLQILESRLDVVVLRAGLARSIYQSRQMVSHAHFRVNGKKVNIPSYQLRIGDKITVREKSKELDSFVLAQQVAKTPEYVTANDKELTAELNRLPEAEEVPVICEISSVVEFYSR
ncbi:MAG: 30S ribosomal protein S4 [Kiritimatiellales bacterium]|nr:30S ribosomal protein S4 [Kiritimatiellales bacterium]